MSVVGLGLAVVVGVAGCLPRGHRLPGDPMSGGPGDLDPRDYDSFEAFFRDASAPLSREYLRERWDRVHAGDPQHPVVPDPEDLPEPVPEGVELGETPLIEYQGSEQIRFALGWSVHDATGRTIPDQRFDGSPNAFERALKRYYGGDPIAALVEHGFTVGYFIPHRGGGPFGGHVVSRDGALLWAVAPMRGWRVGGDYFTLIPLPVPLGKLARPVGWALRGGARVVVYAGRIAAHAVTAVGVRARYLAHVAPAVRAAYRTARAVVRRASGHGARASGAAGRSGAGHAGSAAGRTGTGHAGSAVGRTGSGHAGSAAIGGGSAGTASAARGSAGVGGISAAARANIISRATAAGRGGVSAVGRAIQKHAARPGSAFMSAGGDAAANTAIGKTFLEGLLGNSANTITHSTHAVHGAVFSVRQANGVGAMFTAEGRFIQLLEPFTPR